MANPSLQIGNSNWAIKEDDLLGYSTVGTNYLPKPMTMTRESAGTRVNPEGLVETVELLGAELVTNGDFANWTGDNPDNFQVLNENAANYVTESSNQLRMVSDNSATIAIRPQPTSMLTVGKIYKVSVDLTFTTGSIDISGNSFNSNGTKVFYINAGATYLQIAKTSALDVLIDNVSVKEVTRNNLARVDYTDGTSSLLVEPERTNLLEYSEDFSQSYWRKDKLTLTSNSIISPSGELNASLLQETVYTSSVPSFDLNGAVTLSAGTYTYTFYIKNNNGRYLGISFGSSSERVRTNFDFTTNTFKTLIFSGTTTGTASFTTLGDFYRITITATFPSSIPADTVVMPLATDTYPYYATQNSDNRSFYLWGFSVEEGSYPTSYIPTDGTTVTRVQDQYSKTGISDLINSEEGSFFVDIAAISATPGAQLSISLSGNGSTDRILIFTGSGGGEWNVQFKKDGGTFLNVKKSITVSNQSKLAVSWKSGKYLMYIDGDKATNYTVGSETESTTFDVGDLNNLQFNPHYGTTSNPFYGKVKQLQVYKEALSDSELETLTT